MGFILKHGEADLSFKLCCEAMGRATRVIERNEPDCAPHVDYDWPPTIHGCDAAIAHDPINFCPWCGKQIIKTTNG
jgi:hypothetical protein